MKGVLCFRRGGMYPCRSTGRVPGETSTIVQLRVNAPAGSSTAPGRHRRRTGRLALPSISRMAWRRSGQWWEIGRRLIPSWCALHRPWPPAEPSSWQRKQTRSRPSTRCTGVLPETGNETLIRESARLGRDIPLLRRAGGWLGLAPEILGEQRPSYYLVAWQDPAELRATGGFIGAADFIELRRGSISSRFTGSALSHEIASVPPPLPEARYTPETRWVFRDSNWSPDFPVSARLERWFYGEDTGRWADGVLDFVDSGVSEILHATGPLLRSLPAGSWCERDKPPSRRFAIRCRQVSLWLGI